MMYAAYLLTGVMLAFVLVRPPPGVGAVPEVGLRINMGMVAIGVSPSCSCTKMGWMNWIWGRIRHVRIAVQVDSPTMIHQSK